ncbi:DNA repair RAD52-like protein 2, chloroplastic isoform X3 [Gossypium hirsutum]|uniref:DNA repair RAD52-like protein 2, chloroplastic isoform X3 n=1 Tax=Gossypium hirsutum TaxID=3635 RepID=A0ABM3A8S8_GOSHI|nr:DNA repair RAD52-like protein 2, chloroplastic isoform X3 [Gossypium hirsutum]
MALQLRCGGAFLSQLSDSNNKNGWLVIGGVGWGREPFLGRLRCSSNNNNSNCDAKKGVPDSNYVVPLEKSFSPSNSSCITRPLIEILRDLNKRIPHNIIKSPPNSSTFLPWYHANRMLSFYAPGWCGEVRDVIFANNGTITVVYRLTIRGSDGEVHLTILLKSL